MEAINVALKEVRTPYVLMIDDDTLIGNIKIPTSLLKKKYEAIAFIVLPTVENWITKIQSYEYAKSMKFGKVYQSNYRTVQNISGAIGLFHTRELIRQTKLHTGEFSGEDLQRTLLIHLNNAKGVVLQQSTVYTDAPKTEKGSGPDKSSAPKKRGFFDWLFIKL